MRLVFGFELFEPVQSVSSYCGAAVAAGLTEVELSKRVEIVCQAPLRGAG